MPNRLMRLLRDNAQARERGPLKAEVNGDEATVYIYDVIVADDFWGGVGAESFVKELNGISAPVIHLRINCPGGDVFAGRAIETAIREHPSKVVAHIDGYAASAATYVALAADEVEIAPGGFFMIHKAWTIAVGNSDDFMDSAELLEKIDGSLVKTYATETGMDQEKIAEMMAAETWLDADEAVEMGFVDRIAEGATAASGHWNLSAYEKAPKQAQPEDIPEEDISREHYEMHAKLFEIAR